MEARTSFCTQRKSRVTKVLFFDVPMNSFSMPWSTRNRMRRSESRRAMAHVRALSDKRFDYTASDVPGRGAEEVISMRKSTGGGGMTRSTIPVARERSVPATWIVGRPECGQSWEFGGKMATGPLPVNLALHVFCLNVPAWMVACLNRT